MRCYLIKASQWMPFEAKQYILLAMIVLDFKNDKHKVKIEIVLYLLT